MIKRLSISIGATGSVVALLYSCQPAYCFTQADCNQLAKAQSDAAGREMVVKLRANEKGACVPEQPGTKDPKPAGSTKPRP
jgi:hypothetical protein